MNRKERTSILVQCTKDQLEFLAKRIEQLHTVEVIDAPFHSLVMIKTRESAQNTLFYLGEVLVSECQVKIGSSYGTGIIKGMKLDEAYSLALIDACYNQASELCVWLNEEIKSLQNKQIRQKRKEIAKLRKTMVEFETMDQEVNP